MARFFEGYQWRWVFADIPAGGSSSTAGGIVTSWADGLLTDRVITYTLNQPTVIEASVWPDFRQVNEIFLPDNDPRVAQSNRVIYCFRREGVSCQTTTDCVGPWVCRAAGILMSPEDQGNGDIPLSHFVAYDPWKYLEGRLVTGQGGRLPPSSGWVASINGYGTRADQVVGNLLAYTIFEDGFAFVDAGEDYGGTSFYTGTIEHCPDIAFSISRGDTVASAWTAITDMGVCDIVLTPIYDPVNRPGYTHELNVYNLAGEQRPSAVFSWGEFNRSVTDIDRAHDGTPGNFVDRIQWYAGAGGYPVPLQENNQAIDKYGVYWSGQMFPDQDVYLGAAVEAMAAQQLTLRKQGLRTMTLHPVPERSPIPLRDYAIGDRVLVFAPKALRVATTSSFAQNNTAFRVQGIPITITDDGIEQVNALLTSPDYRTES